MKADSKVLSGMDLRDALDPLEDQSYHFTSARAESNDGMAPVGVSPRSSRLWAGSSQDWSDFLSSTSKLLARIRDSRTPDPAPLPVLAVPSASTRLDTAFDAAFLPPEVEGGEPIVEASERQNAEYLADETVLRITQVDGADFTAAVEARGAQLGTLRFSVNASDPENVQIDVDADAANGNAAELLKPIENEARRRRWLKIRYESGEMISQGVLYSMRHRDVHFEGFEWANFQTDKMEVTKEKPDPLSQTGHQDSLFCWVQRQWPWQGPGSGSRGWLACDDGSMEIADFIHLDLDRPVPLLSLIHIKAAKSDSTARGISVSAYEIVTGQAVKNLRHLDRLLLAEGLANGLGKKISKLVWHDGEPANRRKMVDALKSLGANHDRNVVILQPHLTRSRHEHARGNPDGSDASRLRQLDTLLVSAEASCHGLGARLRCVGEDR